MENSKGWEAAHILLATNCSQMKMESVDGKNYLTDEWENRGVQKGQEFAILTDEITKAWSGLSTREYKQVKGLKKEGLRDHMTNLELVLNMLAEATTKWWPRSVNSR